MKKITVEAFCETFYKTQALIVALDAMSTKDDSIMSEKIAKPSKKLEEVYNNCEFHGKSRMTKKELFLLYRCYVTPYLYLLRVAKQKLLSALDTSRYRELNLANTIMYMEKDTIIAEQMTTQLTDLVQNVARTLTSYGELRKNTKTLSSNLLDVLERHQLLEDDPSNRSLKDKLKLIAGIKEQKQQSWTEMICRKRADRYRETKLRKVNVKSAASISWLVPLVPYSLPLVGDQSLLQPSMKTH